MSLLRPLYWLLTGAMLGFGCLAILSIGLPFLLLGLILAVVGAFRFRGAGLWAAGVGFGGVPAVILLWDLIHTPWACESGIMSKPDTAYYSCVQTPIGPLTTYHLLALGGGVIVLLSLSWPLLQRFRR